MTWANRQPLSAKERVKSSLLDDDGHFGVWIDTSWNPSIRRDGHLLNVERLAPLTCAHQDASLQSRGSPHPFAQILFVDDRHLYGFHELSKPGNACRPSASQHLPPSPAYGKVGAAEGRPAIMRRAARRAQTPALPCSVAGRLLVHRVIAAQKFEHAP